MVGFSHGTEDYTTRLQLDLEAQECQLILGSEDDGVRVCWQFGGQARALAGGVSALR